MPLESSHLEPRCWMNACGNFLLISGCFSVIRINKELKFSATTKRGKPKMIWMIVVGIDMKQYNLSKDLVQERLE